MDNTLPYICRRNVFSAIVWIIPCRIYADVMYLVLLYGYYPAVYMNRRNVFSAIVWIIPCRIYADVMYLVLVYGYTLPYICRRNVFSAIVWIIATCRNSERSYQRFNSSTLGVRWGVDGGFCGWWIIN